MEDEACHTCNLGKCRGVQLTQLTSSKTRFAKRGVIRPLKYLNSLLGGRAAGGEVKKNHMCCHGGGQGGRSGSALRWVQVWNGSMAREWVTEAH